MLFEILGNLMLGWLTADLISGLTHGVGDSWLGDTWLVKKIVTFNADHHKAPLAVVNQSFVERNLTSMFAVILISGAVYAVFGLSPFFVGLTAGGLLVSEVHRWAHAPSKAPAWVRSLQRTGFFQSPKQHAKHHRPPHELNFCLLTDYLNPIIDAMRGVAR